MFRPVLYVLLLITLFVAVVNKSMPSAEYVMSCHDNMSANYLAREIRLTYIETTKENLCNVQMDSIYLYDICYRQLNNFSVRGSIFSRIGISMAKFMRPTLKPSIAYVDGHNNVCSNFTDLVITDLKRQ